MPPGRRDPRNLHVTGAGVTCVRIMVGGNLFKQMLTIAPRGWAS